MDNCYTIHEKLYGIELGTIEGRGGKIKVAANL